MSEKYELIQTIFQGVGLVGLVGIIPLWLQKRSELTWNKLNCSLNRIDMELLKKNMKIIRDHGINMDSCEMSDEEFRKLTDGQSPELSNAVHDILNMWEDFATLYNMDVLNNDYAYESYSEHTLYIYSKFSRIIDFCRSEENDPFYYINIEKCANVFSEINQKKFKIFNKKTQDFNNLKEKTMKNLKKRGSNIKFKLNVF